ncbi:MAG TPA: cyclase family protein [Firmicutes bacterium]|jgi:arylformamidase|nr:cyclase family protein [Bacillota bacterium]HOQ24185.1 cyclase family protein [Bacillota bacterium]HPT67596.1 cyclase family protein [Bacillota bacterium]
MRIWDITQIMEEGMEVYPGDPPFSRRMLSGDDVYISELTFGSHCGTHLDAPAHLILGGATTDHIPPQRFIMPARVLEVPAGEAVSLDRVNRCQLLPGEAVLFKSRTGEGRRRLAYLNLEIAEYLIKSGISLVGVENKSVEADDSPGLPVHMALLQAGVLILEGLDLRKVPPGLYKLVALPLLIKGGDAAPVRAILITGS